MPKLITNDVMEGLFRPFTKVMAKARKQQIVEDFLERGYHSSQSGFTGRLITEHCIANKIRFTAEYIPNVGYIIRKV